MLNGNLFTKIIKHHTWRDLTTLAMLELGPDMYAVCLFKNDILIPENVLESRCDSLPHNLSARRKAICYCRQWYQKRYIEISKQIGEKYKNESICE